MGGVGMGLGEGLEVKLGVWVKVTCTYTHIRAMDGTADHLMLLRLFLFGIF